MSAPTVRATPRFIGESNTYRSYWRPLDGDPPDASNPIVKVDFPSI